MRILFVVNADWFFLSHRLPIALAAKKHGYDVHVAAGITEKGEDLLSFGFTVHPLNLVRGQNNFLGELGIVLQLLALFRRSKPDLVHLVTIKPVIWGGIASRIARVPSVVAAVSGLGFVFVATGWKAFIRRHTVGLLYRAALRRPGVKVVLQNVHDQRVLMKIAGLSPHDVELIPGSGVDLAVFRECPLPNGEPIVMMASRLIVSKGVWEFASAARLLRQRGVRARFVMVGSPDPDNPESLTEADMEKIRQHYGVETWGTRSDMHSVLAEAYLFVLPSYYGEGVPKVLLEAAACGRPIITTDMPGCRDAVDAGLSALLVAPRSDTALAEAIDRLLGDRKAATSMGAAGRRLAEKQFDLRAVVERHLEIYAQLLEPQVTNP